MGLHQYNNYVKVAEATGFDIKGLWVWDLAIVILRNGGSTDEKIEIVAFRFTIEGARLIIETTVKDMDEGSAATIEDLM